MTVLADVDDVEVEVYPQIATDRFEVSPPFLIPIILFSGIEDLANSFCAGFVEDLTTGVLFDFLVSTRVSGDVARFLAGLEWCWPWNG